METALNIYLIEDSISLTKAIEERLIEAFGEDVNIFQFDDVEDALAGQKETPRLIFLDHFLKTSKGIDSIPLLLDKFPLAEIVVISEQNDMEVFKDAYDKGAKGYIRKDALFFHSVYDFVESAVVSNLHATPSVC